MPTDKRIIRLFCMLDDHPGAVKKRADAHLHPREGVTIGLLFCLKGRRESALYRWLNANDHGWFPKLPERPRLQRQRGAVSAVVLPLSIVDNFAPRRSQSERRVCV